MEKDHALTSPVGRVEFDRFRNLALPAVAIGEQFRLVIIELLAGLGGEFEIRPLDDGIDRTGLLAQSAIDAFHHVDVVAHGAAGAIVAARPSLDGDRLRRTDRLAQLAGDAALFAVGIAAQRMLATEPRRDRALLERIIQRRLRLEEIAHGENERRYEFGQQQRAGCGVDVDTHSDLISVRAPQIAAPPRRSPPSPATAAKTPSSRAASVDRSGSAARSPSPSRTGRT